MLVSEMRRYIADRGIARNPLHSASRFVRLMGDCSASEISAENLKEFRRVAEKAGLAAWTIKGTLKDLRTLIRSRGADVSIDRIKKPEPNPQPVTFATIDLLWPHLAGWSRQWLALSYWTGLRLADSIRMQRELTDSRLEWVARKTKHRHKWPVMPWMVPLLQPQALPYSNTDDWSKVIVRAELDRACVLAGVDRMQPSQIRDTGLRAWVRADFHAGKVLHGCGLGVIGHYVDVLDILEPVAPRVRVPDSMRGNCNGEDTETTLLANFRRMDPQAQSLISSTAERLSAG
jgi:hypothetical protein